VSAAPTNAEQLLENPEDNEFSISDEEWNAGLAEMGKPVEQRSNEHPFSAAVRVLAKAHGLAHVVWAFGEPGKPRAPNGLCTNIVAGTTTTRRETRVLTVMANLVATRDHENMRSEKLAWSDILGGAENPGADRG
jgi:hypothetical protein